MMLSMPAVDHVIEGDLIDLRDELCVGVELSIEGEEDILLVKSGEGHKGNRRRSGLLPEEDPDHFRPRL